LCGEVVSVASIVPFVSGAVEMDVDAMLAFAGVVGLVAAPLAFAVRLGEVSLSQLDGFKQSSTQLGGAARAVRLAIENVRDGGSRLSDGTELLALQVGAVDELAAAGLLGGG
jgi:hypothetical protein